MNELKLLISIAMGDDVLPSMTFTTFANIKSRFYFKTNMLITMTGFANKIKVSLVCDYFY
ncbi:hypothetical protein [Thiospirillum jenense]|uniref:Uncharacterized protein n=1 Tax=Thiospirillum jenense TaxID=1653858 RepID=A0A839HDA4_9GAMM|nr:hypothetical protein [Thiospirillum jenense]MBB1126883.1 hypothetical protein [Thiospirillum jenense]